MRNEPDSPSVRSPEIRTARRDDTLRARVVGVRPLRYAAGADPALDRPAHVRAASGIARVGARLAVVQDDSAFLALIDPHTGLADALTLPAGEGGARQFDDARGNKRFKPDLEACITVQDGGRALLLAFGSGSSPRRERVLVVDGWEEDEPRVRWVDASALYAGLRAATDFAGSDMNVEGAAVLGGALHLFGRGNGASRGDLRAVNARCALDLAALLAYLRDPATRPPPRPADVAQYELGDMEGLRLGFTDAAVAEGGTVFFTAAAEDSPDATRDGRVAGSAVGRIDRDGTAVWTVLADAHGRPFPGKAEGLLLRDAAPTRAWVVVDHDDPARPSELCDVELAFG